MNTLYQIWLLAHDGDLDFYIFGWREKRSIHRPMMKILAVTFMSQEQWPILDQWWRLVEYESWMMNTCLELWGPTRMDVPHRFKHLLESCALWLPLRVRNIETEWAQSIWFKHMLWSAISEISYTWKPIIDASADFSIHHDQDCHVTSVRKGPKLTHSSWLKHFPWTPLCV